jgi:hypothetical protein
MRTLTCAGEVSANVVGAASATPARALRAMKSRRFMRFEYKDPGQVEMRSICCRMRGVRLQLLRSTGKPG